MSTLPGGPGALWGSAIGTGGTPQVGVPLSSLVMPAYRIAGIQGLPMTVPNPEMYSEAISELNRMMGSWNLDGFKVFTTSIADYAMVANQKIYTIGPGGNIDAPRPNFIVGATLMYPTDPVVRFPIRILDDDEWRAIAVQDIPGAPTYRLYYDGSMNALGQGQIYVYFQPPDGYRLELYTWQGFSTSFANPTDVAVLPDGYNDAIVQNLAARLIGLNPHRCGLDGAQRQEVRNEAERTLRTIISLNMRSPKMNTSMGLGDGYTGPNYGWLDGNIR